MNEKCIDKSEVDKKLEFIIKYCDMYIEYCHNENLSIDGDLTAEIYDNIYILEDYINNKDSLNQENIDEIIETVNEIKSQLLSINDIDLFNHIHIIFEYTTETLISILEK